MAKRKQKKVKHPLTKQQIEDFLAVFNGPSKTAQRNKLYFKTLLELGARCNEITVMRFCDLYRDEDGDPYYHLETSKSGKGDFLPMSEKLYRELKALGRLYGSTNSQYIFRPVSKNEPIKDSYLRKICAEAGIKAKIPFPVGTHTFRRSFAYHLLKKTNGDIYTVSRLLRHANITTTTEYLSMYNDEKKKAVKGLFE